MTSNCYAPKIYLYSFRAGRWIAQFDAEEKLLEYFVRNYSAFFGPDNDVNFTWNDTKTCVDPLTGKQTTVLRDYVLVDESDRVVDPARYKDSVEALMKGLSETELERIKAYERMGFSIFGAGGREMCRLSMITLIMATFCAMTKPIIVSVATRYPVPTTTAGISATIIAIPKRLENFA